MGIGAVTIGLAVVALLAWATYLVNAGRVRRAKADEVPQNLQPYLTDDDLETRRLDKVLISAVLATAVLALVVPLYYLGEPERQVEAAEGFLEEDVHFGAEWFHEFQCENCHGLDGGGGGAPFVEKRSGLNTTWAAPSINDVFYRYSEDEVRYWIVFGRAGTPMPPAGLEGGGAMTEQQVDQVIAYLRSIEVPQSEAFGKADNEVNLALSRLDGADAKLAEEVVKQRDVIAGILAAPALYATVESLPADLEAIVTGDGTCTSASAELFSQPCERRGVDGDRDGLADAAETMLEGLFARAFAAFPDAVRLDLVFDPADGFSNEGPTGPIADLEALNSAITVLDRVLLNVSVLAENQEKFIASAEAGLAFLDEAARERRYAIDYEAVAERGFDGDVEAARRAAGLYNAYCARCHTAGYQAGVAFTQEAGSGAFGPSLIGGRSVVQFPDFEDHLDFIINGSENAKPYGINGVGRGWMPGFGFVLSEADLRLIVQFERTLP